MDSGKRWAGGTVRPAQDPWRLPKFRLWARCGHHVSLSDDVEIGVMFNHQPPTRRAEVLLTNCRNPFRPTARPLSQSESHAGRRIDIGVCPRICAMPKDRRSPLPVRSNPPALVDQAKDLKVLRDAVVDAATISTGLWLSYIFVQLYFFIAVGGVSYRDLFLESPVKLPFLGVDLPLVTFFVIGPALFFIVHAYVLLHFVLFARKVGVFHTELQAQISNDEIRTQLRWQLPSNVFVQSLAGAREVRGGLTGRMLRLVVQISLVWGPLSLLVLFQVKFLPYHPTPLIALWLRGAVLIDLTLLWMLWPSIIRGNATRVAWLDFRRAAAVPVAAFRLLRSVWGLRWVDPSNKPILTCWRVLCRVGPRGTVVAAASASLILILFVFTISTYSGEWIHGQLHTVPPLAGAHNLLFTGEPDEVTGRPTSLLSDRLILTDESFVDSDKLTKVEVSRSLRGRDLRGAILNRADLRKVDFTGANLFGAQLKNARLERAILSCANAALNWSCAQLQNTSLYGADLKATIFVGANLQGADLGGADAAGANFFGAQLGGASLAVARLDGAIFTAAYLQGANLSGARLHGALFSARVRSGVPNWELVIAQVRQVPFVGAELQAADLSFADLQGADLSGTELQGANLSGAHLDGVSLDGAGLWRVRGNFRNRLIDFGKCDPERMPWHRSGYTEFKTWMDKIFSTIPEGVLYKSAEERLAVLGKISPSDLIGTALLKAACAQDHPQDEERRRRLARFLADLGCSSHSAPFVALGLLLSRRIEMPIFGRVIAERLQNGKSNPAEKCPGIVGFTEQDWANVYSLHLVGGDYGAEQ